MKLLGKLGIYGWDEKIENILLASILTGDPLLMIAAHGTAKTALAEKIAKVIKKKFLAYDASKALFEDVLGYPNIEKLKQGKVEYIESSVTIWDKEFVLIDELNRALPEMQNKWLEIIRSRKIMGFNTGVKWVWSAMNPMTYSATQALDQALIGRFAWFIYPPDILSMEEEDRIKVTEEINGADAPSLSCWINSDEIKTVTKKDIEELSIEVDNIIKEGAKIFMTLRKDMSNMSMFFAKFAQLISKETKGEVALDGRRLGFMYRNLLALRSIELAKHKITGEKPNNFEESAKFAIVSSIPMGLNDDSVNNEELIHKIEVVFDLLGEFFAKDSDIKKIDLIYELFTTNDQMRKIEILITENIREMAKTKAWNNFLKEDGENKSLLCYVAAQIEARKPGTLPKEMIEGITSSIVLDNLSTNCLNKLTGNSIEHIDEVTNLLERKSDLEKIIAISWVSKVPIDGFNENKIDELELKIEDDIIKFKKLMKVTTNSKISKGENK